MGTRLTAYLPRPGRARHSSVGRPAPPRSRHVAQFRSGRVSRALRTGWAPQPELREAPVQSLTVRAVRWPHPNGLCRGKGAAVAVRPGMRFTQQNHATRPGDGRNLHDTQSTRNVLTRHPKGAEEPKSSPASRGTRSGSAVTHSCRVSQRTWDATQMKCPPESGLDGSSRERRVV